MTPPTDDSETRKQVRAVLLEDYKIRWAELLSLTAELNRWRSLYLLALLGGLTWLMTQRGDGSDLFGGKAYIVYAISVVNGIFGATQAWNAWAIHQNGRFLYGFLGPRLSDASGHDIARWDEWRRSEDSLNSGGRHAPKIDRFRRSYGLVQALTIWSVSFGLIACGARWGGLSGAEWTLALAAAILLTSGSLLYVAAVSVGAEKRWADAIRNRRDNDTKKAASKVKLGEAPTGGGELH